MAAFEPVTIHLGDRTSEVVVGNGILAELGARSRRMLRARRAALVTDTNVDRLFGDAAQASLERADFIVERIVVAAGEASKSMAGVETICRRMLTAGLDRSSCLVALGGGVVGDLAGFAAAIFQRGVPVVQVPTTVVAQVDSSIGGKTAVNLPEGKNLVGAFHQPSLVLADADTLLTLPEREWAEGFAEIIKHAAIRDPAMLAALDGVRSRSGVAPLIHRNVAIKARVVEEDELETNGARAHLNFGHTIGHAIETAAGYGRLMHGEAISLGLRAALDLSERHAGLDPAQSHRVLAALASFGLPLTLSDDVPDAAVLESLGHDKKFLDGAIRFILVPELGRAIVSDEISPADLAGALTRLRQPPVFQVRASIRSPTT